MNPTECLDCKKDTVKMLEYYMVTPELWRTSVSEEESGGMLCIGCLEKRIKRKLDMGDFILCPLNLHNLFRQRKCSKRLWNRLSGDGRVQLQLNISY